MEGTDVCQLSHMPTPEVPSRLHKLNVEEEWYAKENERAFIRRGMEAGQIKKNSHPLYKLSADSLQTL